VSGVVRGADVRLLKGREALERVEAAWRRLWARCSEATPFQHPDWLLPWARHFGEEEFLAVTRWSGAELIGLIPFFTLSEKGHGREMLLLGTGNSDYLDPLLAPEVGVEGARTLLARALEESGASACELRQLRPGSPLLAAPPPPGWGGEAMPDEPCPVLTLPPSAERLGEVVPKWHLKRLARERRRAERAGGVRVERADEERFDEIFDALCHLHQRRWEARGEPGIFGDPAAAAFHREAARAFLRSGALRLYSLRIDGRIAAAIYAIQSGARVYLYLGAFDLAFARRSPGTLVIAHAIEAAIGEGATEFDFLRGREEYKYVWGAVERPTYRRRLRAPGEGRRAGARERS
jgi:CelD/BcsL family acetyltransferase involved in cellulose biosynthesis